MLDTVERYIETLLSSSPEAPRWHVERIQNGSAPHWNYIDGCMLRALWRLGRLRQDERFFTFVQSFIDYYISPEGALLGYNESDYNLDNICEGNVLLDLMERVNEPRYLLGVERLLSQLNHQPRTWEGSYWHKGIYPDQVWLDGLYMAQVFRARYACKTGDAQMLGDILRQFQTVRKRMFDAKAGLYRHGYDASGKAFWADPNGLSSCVWLRSMGWFVAAIADTAAAFPVEHAGRGALAALLDEALSGLFAYQDKESGLFFQVVDQGARAGNYTETSGSALIAYACMRAANAALLQDVWFMRGAALFDAIAKNRLHAAKGSLALTGICLVAGLGPENNRRRDGSFAYYISEPVVENDAKGAAPFLMAYAEHCVRTDCIGEMRVRCPGKGDKSTAIGQ